MFAADAPQVVWLVNLSANGRIALQIGPNSWGKAVANAFPRSKGVPNEPSSVHYPFASPLGIDTL